MFVCWVPIVVETSPDRSRRYPACIVTRRPCSPWLKVTEGIAA